MSIETGDLSSARAGVEPWASVADAATLEKPARRTRLRIAVGCLLAIDFFSVASSMYLSTALYYDVTFKAFPPTPYIWAALVVGALFVSISLGFRHLGALQKRQLHRFLWNGVGAVALSFVLFLSFIFLLKIAQEYSRGAFLFQFVGVTVAACTSRTFTFLWFRSAVVSGAVEGRRTILIGDTALYSNVIDELRGDGIHIVGTVPLRRSDGRTTFSLDDNALTSNVVERDLRNLCRRMLPDDIVILAGGNDLTLASTLARSLSELPCNVHIAPLDAIKFLSRSQIADLGGMMTLRVSGPPLSLADLIIKRAFDILISAIALLVLSPLFLIVALAIKLDSPGEVFFRQKRHGYNNQVIRVFKFRSMRATSEDDKTFIPTARNDCRVTAIGRILRQTNIDELPQLVNVLLGDMSIVGPRPHATAHNKMFEDQIAPFARRHNMKPGITGWAQVNGHRGPADTVERMRARVEYDLYYIDNWSFFFDLKIIVMTLFSRNAYLNAY